MCDAEKDWLERSLHPSDPVQSMATKKSPLDETEMIFYFSIFKLPATYFYRPFYSFGPQLNTVLTVGIPLTYFRRKLLKFE